MERDTSGFVSELRVSAKPMAALLVVLGQVLVFVGGTQSDTFDQLEVVLLGVLVHVSSALVWWLDDLKPWAGRWLLVLVLVGSIHLGNGWLGMPQILTLLVIPTGLAAALISLPAATIIATSETLLLALLPQQAAVGADPATIAIALAVVWATLGVLYAVYHPVYQLNRWLSEYFKRGWRLLEEARDRKAEVEQALEDLSHANRQLALANERMTALRLIAEEAQEAKSQFVARVSHEFRAPLNMIIGLVDLMMESPETYAEEFPPDLWTDLEIVHRNCEHLSSMINDVLDLTQAETGRLVLHRRQVDLAEIIDGALTVVSPLIEKKRLDLQVMVPDELSQVYCDRTRIRQVVLNLLSNAARFTEKGGITIHIEDQGQTVTVGVTDTGPGISPQDAKRLFDPFYQLPSDRSPDKKRGSGLGLSISKQFIDLHGGRIWLQSELGAGTTFFFQLPVSPPVEHVARPGHQIREDWVWREHAFKTDRTVSVDQLLKPRVIVYDEVGGLYREFARRSEEVEFVDADDLDQAMRALQQCPAQAVVLNAAAPDDLLGLIEAFRRETSETPVVGCSVPRPAERALESGALGHLVKPVTQADLHRAVQAVGRPVRRVLLVDDDPDVLRLFARMLYVCDETLEVIGVSNGEQALDELRRRSYDLVLLDIVLPDTNGWEILDLIRQDGRMGDAPVFLVSAQDPADQPMKSRFLVATRGDGLSISELLHCSLEFSAHLLEPDRGLDRVRERTPDAGRASAGRVQRQGPTPDPLP